MSASIATAVRPSWHELPYPLRDGLAARLGAVVSARVQTGGFTPGFAVRLRLATGESVFAKGIGVDHVLATKYRAEAAVARALPSQAPAPQLRWDGEIANWVVLIFDDVNGWHADLSPGSPDVGRVVTAVAELEDALTPCPVLDAPSAAEELAGLVHGWRELAADLPADLDDWSRRHVHDLAGLETTWLAAVDGDTLLHGDINRSNLLIDRDQAVWLIDWAQPVRGAAWIDVVDLVPHLILAGHTPTAAEDALSAAPAWRGTDAEVITSYAAAFAGYWARTSRQEPPPGVPHLRAHQARAAQAAIRWTAYRTGWS
ncbi:phosphotransferase family protein (plasmid) [Streptosporangium sp. CA-135522]|uniref:phosphotransferase family protein n=1 Tax=Streptosporangium sp. CA-135522 TaxID=3240072 RepID=UPI003D8D2D69